MRLSALFRGSIQFGPLFLFRVSGSNALVPLGEGFISSCESILAPVRLSASADMFTCAVPERCTLVFGGDAVVKWPGDSTWDGSIPNLASSAATRQGAKAERNKSPRGCTLFTHRREVNMQPICTSP
jgi:hypothetical protein